MKWNQEYQKSIHIITCIALNNNTPNNCDISYRITIQSTKLVTCFQKSFIGEIDKTGLEIVLIAVFLGGHMKTEKLNFLFDEEDIFYRLQSHSHGPQVAKERGIETGIVVMYIQFDTQC